MKDKNRTTSVHKDLMALPKDTEQYKAFMKEHPVDPTYCTLAEYFNAYLLEHNELTIPLIVKRSGQDSGYVHQILNGRKQHPGKYKLIAICIAMEMDIVSTRRALRIAGQPNFDDKNYTDMGIIICINNGCHEVSQVEEFLYDAEQESPFQTE